MQITSLWRGVHRDSLIIALIATAVAAVIGFTTPAHGQAYTVQGVLWADTNGNGIREAGEDTLPGAIISLMYVGYDGIPFTSDDQLIEQSSASTGTAFRERGEFRFSLTGPGESYYLAILNSDKPSGYVPTLYRQGSSATDSDLLARTDLAAFVTDVFQYNGTQITGIGLGLTPLQLDEQLYLPLLQG